MNRRRTLAAALALSAAAHTAAIFPEAIRYAARPATRFASALYDDYKKGRIQGERERLVSEARASLREGKLRLGEFVLKANEIDAREEGASSDLGRAKEAYRRLRDSLSASLSRGIPPREALPLVLRDVEYHGISGGRMADALLEGGGSCEQVSQLSVSLLYDTGHKDSAYLRVYGAGLDGIGHIAPIYSARGEEHDLMAGTPSDRRGVLLPGGELVEAYAKSHGLSVSENGPARESGVESPDRSDLPDGRPSGFAYPRSPDAYGGSAPLFAGHAFQPKDSGSSPGFASDGNGDGPLYEPHHFLTPQNMARLPSGTGGGFPRVHFVSPLPKAEITALSSLIERQRRWLRSIPGSEENRWARAVAYGTLAGLYREAAWNFALLGRFRLMEAAQELHARVLKESAPHLEKLGPMPGGIAPFIRYLVYLGKGGEDTLFRLLENETGPMRPDTLAFLIASESSRERALKAVGRRPEAEQARLSSILREVELEGVTGFERSIGIFRAITDTFASPGPEAFAARRLLIPGEAIVSGNSRLRLDGVDFERSGERTSAEARFSVFTKGKELIRGLRLAEGRTVTLSLGGSEIPVKFIGMRLIQEDQARALGFPETAGRVSRPEIGILSKPPGADFGSLARAVHGSCASAGLGGEWEEAITAASAGWLLEQRSERLDGTFGEEFAGWARGRESIAYFVPEGDRERDGDHPRLILRR